MFNDEDEKSVINLIATSSVECLPYHRLSTHKANADVFKLLKCYLAQLSVFHVQNTVA